MKDGKVVDVGDPGPHIVLHEVEVVSSGDYMAWVGAAWDVECAFNWRHFGLGVYTDWKVPSAQCAFGGVLGPITFRVMRRRLYA